MKQPCEVIQDLLPLYHDQIASRSSRQLVEDHLKDCQDCQRMYDDLINTTASIQTEQTRNVKQLRKQIRWHGIKRMVMIGLLSVIVVPLILVTYMSFVAQEGLTFEAIAAHWKAQRAFDAILDQEYEQAVSYLGFWGYNEDRTQMGAHLVEQEKARWIEKMNRYDDQYQILEAKVSNSYTDDGFTHVYVALRIADNSGTYDLLLKVAYYGKHDRRPNALYPVDIYPNFNVSLDGNEHAKEKVERVGYALLDIIYTYNPG